MSEPWKPVRGFATNSSPGRAARPPCHGAPRCFVNSCAFLAAQTCCFITSFVKGERARAEPSRAEPGGVAGDQTNQQYGRTLLSGHDYHKQGKQGLEGEAGARGKWHQPNRRRAGDHVRAGTEPAFTGADERRNRAAEAAAAHPEEPGLRRELPGEARHPEGGAGKAKGSAAAGSGQAGHGERQHEGGAGRSALKVRGPAELRQDCGPQPRHLSKGAHGLRHRASHPR